MPDRVVPVHQEADIIFAGLFHNLVKLHNLLIMLYALPAAWLYLAVP